MVCVTDATNLRQNLRLVLSLKRLGLPMVIALNMTDIARRKGIVIDAARLAGEVAGGVPPGRGGIGRVIRVVAGGDNKGGPCIVCKTCERRPNAYANYQ